MTDEVITVGERYATATHSSNLLPRLDRRTDADILLAAGIAASGDPRLKLALKVWRMRECGDLGELWTIAEHAEGWLGGFLSRKGNRPMPRAAKRALVVDVLKWWMHPTCPYCEGRKWIVEDDAPSLTRHECRACHGTGQRPLSREVPHALIRHAQFLEDSLNQHASVIFGRMAALLKNRMEL